MVSKLVEEGRSFLVYDRDESAMDKIKGKDIKPATLEEVCIYSFPRWSYPNVLCIRNLFCIYANKGLFNITEFHRSTETDRLCEKY